MLGRQSMLDHWRGKSKRTFDSFGSVIQISFTTHWCLSMWEQIWRETSWISLWTDLKMMLFGKHINSRMKTMRMRKKWRQSCWANICHDIFYHIMYIEVGGKFTCARNLSAEVSIPTLLSFVNLFPFLHVLEDPFYWLLCWSVGINITRRQKAWY